MNTDNQVRKKQTYNCNKNYSRQLKVLQKNLFTMEDFNTFIFLLLSKKLNCKHFVLKDIKFIYISLSNSLSFW